MGTQYLSDTNTVIEFLSGAFSKEKSAWLQQLIDDNRNNLSVINQIELLGFNAEPEELKIIEDFLAENKVLPLSTDVVKKTVELRRSFRIKLPDAIIAATASVHNLVLLTRNTADFKSIPGIAVLNLWESDPRSK